MCKDTILLEFLTFVQLSLKALYTTLAPLRSPKNSYLQIYMMSVRSTCTFPHFVVRNSMHRSESTCALLTNALFPEFQLTLYFRNYLHIITDLRLASYLFNSTAKTMTRSWDNVPHVYKNFEVQSSFNTPRMEGPSESSLSSSSAASAPCAIGMSGCGDSTLLT